MKEYQWKMYQNGTHYRAADTTSGAADKPHFAREVLRLT